LHNRLNALLTWHDDIGQDEIDSVGAHEFDGLMTVCSLEYIVPGLGQGRRDYLPEEIIIVDYENVRHGDVDLVCAAAWLRSAR
jgi:hypothetical protein